MFRFPLKYIFLTLFVIINIFGINKVITTIPLLKFYFIAGIIPLILIYVARLNLINLLMLFFVSILFKEFGQLPIPLLPDIFPWRLVWVILFTVLAYELLSRRREKILPLTDIEIAMVLFSIVTILSMISAGTFYQEGKGLTLNYFLNGYGFPFSIFFLAKNLVDSEAKLKKMFIFFAVIGLYLGLTGIFEHFNVHQLVIPSKIMIPWEGVSWGRARGPFMNSAVNGTAIGMIIFMLIYLLLHERIIWRKIFYVITLACTLATMVFTLTRGCWIAFMVAIFISSIFISQVRKVFIPGFIGLIAIIIIIFSTQEIHFSPHYTEYELNAQDASLKEKIIYRTQKWETITGRIDLYRISFKMFVDRPLFGYGYGAFVKAKEEFISQYNENISGEKFIQNKARGHDTLVGILVDLGLVGFGFLFYIVLRFFHTCKKLYNVQKNRPEMSLSRDLPVLIASIFIVYLINIQTIDIRNFLFPNSLFFLLAGIIVGIDQRAALDRPEGHDFLKKK